MAWGIKCCDECAGTGMAFCRAHERACDHDRLCPECRGRGFHPVELDALDSAARDETYPSAAAAWAVLAAEFEHV